jgi:hypothetical protein
MSDVSSNLIQTAVFLFIVGIVVIWANQTEPPAKKIKVIVPDYFSALDCTDLRDAPSAESAVKHAMCDEDVQDTLEDKENQVFYKNWEIVASQMEAFWRLKMVSNDWMPSMQCTVDVKTHGDVGPMACEINK